MPSCRVEVKIVAGKVHVKKADCKVHVNKVDIVVVISGKDDGKKGKVIEVIKDKNRVVVEGVNITKKHTKPTQQLPQGGIIAKESPIASSNVLVFCNKCDRPVRTGRTQLEDGKRVRVCRNCGEMIDK